MQGDENGACLPAELFWSLKLEVSTFVLLMNERGERRRIGDVEGGSIFANGYSSKQDTSKGKLGPSETSVCICGIGKRIFAGLQEA